MAKRGMTCGELLNLLEEEAKKYRKEALSSVEHNRYMNNLSFKDISKLKKEQRLTQKLIDAILVDFINRIGNGQGGDYGLRTEHL
ncbi:MAG: hypothetical protein L6266_01965 [Nanoarchaeota archaeon]|nr:hypothetical protein [Patescibacteria group bacterium]MCG2719488.1 hypothetical protein [Nanoarchaeota archaeon]